MTQPFNVQDIVRTQLLMGLTTSTGATHIKNIILFNLYERVVQTFPIWFPSVKAFCCRRQRNTSASTPPPPKNREIRCTINCERTYTSTSGKQQTQTTLNHSKMDSVIHYITTIPAIRNLLCISHNDYLPHEFEPIQLEPDLYFQLLDLKRTDATIEEFKFKLFCYDHEIQYLQGFVDKCNVDYERRMANKLGTDLYFFDMMVDSKSKSSMKNPLPASHILYTKHKFYTTRTFDNVFFEEREKVRKHVEFFLKKKDWYEKKGIPYTIGFMFHGDPGCGKTSTVKAIANTARRHIINIQLSEIKSKEQLRHLFFSDELYVYNGATTEKYTIPVHERLYVIEDIDAMGDAVLRREWKKPVIQKETKKGGDDAWFDRHKEEEKEPIDLSFLLNLLDGTLEAHGRMIAISSNFPERIDRALIRPGRIDMIVHFKKCNRSVLHEMIESFYDIKIDKVMDESMDYKWSPAEVNQILFRNFDNYEHAIVELETLKPTDLYGFDNSQTAPTSYEEFTHTLSPNA